MRGKRLSLVCCSGPGAFHFPGLICFERFGGGRFALSSNSVCMAILVLIFKRDTIIINHLLELSGTRVKYLDHEKRAYKLEI